MRGGLTCSTAELISEMCVCLFPSHSDSPKTLVEDIKVWIM